MRDDSTTGPVTYREALDLQQQLTKAAGSHQPAYLYRIEEHGKTNVQAEGAGTSTGINSNTGTQPV
tara:strand:- start:934 stop:1131 length:198 start_codon:yes stop_codon:yes gene_type:complete